MEEGERELIPTLSRTKIAGSLSYPIGAEQVSLALKSVPQFHHLGLHFYSWGSHGLNWGEYEFLRVEYLYNVRPAEQWPITSQYRRPRQNRWEIVVQPVPRLLRHAIKDFIIKTALQHISQWLKDREGLQKRGNDILAFFFDEKQKEFITRRLTRVEPMIE